MRISLSSDITARIPTYTRFVLVARGIDNRGEPPEVQRLLAEATEAIRVNPALVRGADYPQIASWREAFRQFDVDPDMMPPSVQALVDRVRNHEPGVGAPVAFHNKIVALFNSISLKYLVPSGADDLGKVRGDFGLRLATGSEIFVGVGSNRTERPQPREVILADRRKVMCRSWVWHQGVHTQVTPNTRDVAVNIDVLPPITREQGETIAAELAGLVRQFCGGTVTTFTLDRDHLVAEFEAPPSTLEEGVFDVLELRGYIEQTDDRDQVRNLLNEGTVIYQGFDPTKSSLHIGHLMSLMVFHYLQQAGNKMVFILGGGTAQVGDPSGRAEGRKMITTEEVTRNAEAMKVQVQGMGLVNFGPGATGPSKSAAVMLDNAEWLKMDLLDYAREVTPHFSVNQMIKREDFKRRLDQNDPLSLFEFIYTTLQGYDYLHLYDHYGVRVQMGGNDQWINILDGVNLIQRKRGATAHAMTLPLLLDRTGEKMGKTSTGETIWLAGGGEPSTSPFDFYQYWVNCPDEDTERNFRLFTFLPMEEIDAILAGHPREAQHRLAYEVTKIVHGEEIARQLQVDSLRAFKGTGLPSEVPTVVLSAAEAQAGVPLITLLTQVGVRSRSEARRLIEQGGVLVNGERLGQGDMQYQIGLKDFRDFDGEKAAVIRFGKGKAAKVLLR